jgi:hypothetical protein
LPLINKNSGSDSHEGQAGYNAITGVYAKALTGIQLLAGSMTKNAMQPVQTGPSSL